MANQRRIHLSDVSNDKYKTNINGRIKGKLSAKPSNENIQKNQMETQSTEAKMDNEVFHLLSRADSNKRFV